MCCAIYQNELPPSTQYLQIKFNWESEFTCPDVTLFTAKVQVQDGSLVIHSGVSLLVHIDADK